MTKVEHPENGDPYRGLVTGGIGRTTGGIDPRFHMAHPGKDLSPSILKQDGDRGSH